MEAILEKIAEDVAYEALSEIELEVVDWLQDNQPSDIEELIQMSGTKRRQLTNDRRGEILDMMAQSQQRHRKVTLEYMEKKRKDPNFDLELIPEVEFGMKIELQKDPVEWIRQNQDNLATIERARVGVLEEIFHTYGPVINHMPKKRKKLRGQGLDSRAQNKGSIGRVPIAAVWEVD